MYSAYRIAVFIMIAAKMNTIGSTSPATLGTKGISYLTIIIVIITVV